MKTLNLAVIGKDVSKSDSPAIHKFIAENTGNRINYKSVSVPENQFELKIDGLLKEYDGFNITIPYKISVIPHLKTISGDALVFGAVNTVDTHTKSGYNTDGLGFSLMLKTNGVEVQGKTALVLGAGGAGRSVAKKLADAGAVVSIYDKNYETCLAVADEFEGVIPIEKISVRPHYLVVNATGIGMHSTEGVSPADEELLKLCSVALDLIYVPAKSRFLEIAESLGKKIINGAAMLFYQAYYSECIYFGTEPDETQAKELFKKYTEKNL